ncbi:MAG TPA: hypothetical protein VI703_00975 [Anaerolineales bacterium]|nr:hypothetical protein [Anaerolineales bacterium]
MPAKNSPNRRPRKSVKQPHSSLVSRSVPALLILLAATMAILILFAIGVIAGIVPY